MAQQSPQKIRELRLPISRVKTIMKSSPHVDSVGQDGLFLVAKATEMFIHHLTLEAYIKANRASNLDYKHLAEVVQTSETLEFLKEIMPRKITVRKFKELMAAKEAAQNSSSDSSDSDSDSDSASQGDSESASGSDDEKESSNNQDDNVKDSEDNAHNNEPSNSDSESENTVNDKRSPSTSNTSTSENED
ncbi:chromatin accessibility complex protein 1 [Chelonus insularis]|uniref:chromatin accessibility complex protein 1 n=1 Tax=Chelonus insularis TaxID=460826 RepID=UPI00158EC4F6|nr:chromatin accessibility complex protein 1 [Chelonus insularis]